MRRKIDCVYVKMNDYIRKKDSTKEKWTFYYTEADKGNFLLKVWGYCVTVAALVPRERAV